MSSACESQTKIGRRESTLSSAGSQCSPGVVVVAAAVAVAAISIAVAVAVSTSSVGAGAVSGDWLLDIRSAVGGHWLRNIGGVVSRDSVVVSFCDVMSPSVGVSVIGGVTGVSE